MPDTSLSLFRAGGLTQLSDPLQPFFYGESARIKATILANNAVRGAGSIVTVFSGRPYYTSTSVTFNMSIGSIHGSPTRGSFQLGTGAATAAGIPHNATTTQLKNAVSGVYGNVTVTTYGRTTADGWIITAATANTALTLNGQSESLSPYSTVNVLDLTAPASGVTAQKIVRLRRSPAISVTTFGLPTTVATASVVTLSSTLGDDDVRTLEYRVDIPADTLKLNSGYRLTLHLTGAATGDISLGEFSTSMPLVSSGVDGLISRFEITEDPLRRGALLTSFYRSNAFIGTEGGFVFSTSSTADLSGAFRNVTTVVVNGVTFQQYRMVDLGDWSTNASTANGYRIRFRPRAKNNVVSYRVSLTDTGVRGDGFFDLGPVTFSGAQLDELFEEANKNEVALTLEVNLTENGFQQTLLQAPVTVRRTVA